MDSRCVQCLNHHNITCILSTRAEKNVLYYKYNDSEEYWGHLGKDIHNTYYALNNHSVMLDCYICLIVLKIALRYNYSSTLLYLMPAASIFHETKYDR